MNSSRNFDSLVPIIGEHAGEIEKHDSIIDRILSKLASILPPAILGLGNIYDVRAFGTLAKAITYIGGDFATLYITNEQAVATNTTIPSNISIVVLRGGSFAISTGVVLTINGAFEAGLFQVFSGLGTVAIAGNFVHPEWWGNDYAQMSTTAGATMLQVFASKSNYSVASNVSLNGRIQFMDGAKLVPASGVTVTIGASAVIRADSDWADTSSGGSFTYLAGAFEERLITRVTSPTNGRTINTGFPGNIIDETSGVCWVFGGVDNFEHSLGSASELSSISGGYDNHIGNDCAATTIAGGAHHEVADDSGHTFIGGGAYQKSYAGYAVLCGGTLNNNYSTFGFLGGGHENTLGDPLVTPIDQRASVLVGGYLNNLKGLRAVLVGGYQNIVNAAYAFVGGGQSNNASGENSVITGGQGNVASARNTVALGGQSNQATSLAAIVGGESATATANYAVAIGEFLDATATAAWATGMRAKAYLAGMRAHASGYFAAKGDAQISDLVARRVTVASQTVDLDLAGTVGLNPIALPNNTSWCFRIRLIARNISASENGAWTYEGAIKRDANAASTALIGAVTATTINAPAGWTVTVQADTSAGALQIQVSTDATVTGTIRWVARIELVEAAG